ncbi:TPA: hypothetical protein JAN90_13810 [Legionella pneumophila]|nr:hypothetical protein [Legionella pneumophila]HAT8868221.1 hypothetical protein [Legionella pneumophila subsp. pneumophila]HAT8889476.1 hypothetical protein [Legionella pneumophila subsp. pneumophila]HAT8933070.1 hypothetical protein [Legionella pneumophila subsp. pneumophila]HAU0162722.1 PhzF family phenazine biosynthesis protein [Legionella pneumophila]
MDAFASSIFSGNPAAVCVLDQWLSKEQMQFIASERHSAFLVCAFESAPYQSVARAKTPGRIIMRIKWQSRSFDGHLPFVFRR